MSLVKGALYGHTAHPYTCHLDQPTLISSPTVGCATLLAKKGGVHTFVAGIVEVGLAVRL